MNLLLVSSVARMKGISHSTYVVYELRLRQKTQHLRAGSRDNVGGDQLPQAHRFDLLPSRLDRRLHRRDVALDQHGDVPPAELLPTEDLDVAGLAGRVDRLDDGRQP